MQMPTYDGFFNLEKSTMTKHMKSSRSQHRGIGHKMKVCQNRNVFMNIVTYSFLAALGIVAFWMVLTSTSLYGPGMSSDAINYLSTAKHLMEGKGYISYSGQAYVHWPPLFPTLLALLGLGGIEPLSGARFLNAVCFGLIVFCSGLIFSLKIKSKLLVLCGTSAVLLSFTLLRVSVYAWSEPLFIFLNILFVFSMTRFLETGKKSLLISAGITTALACLQKYAGIGVILSGVASIILFSRESSWHRRLPRAILFGILTLVPVGIWLILNKIRSTTAAEFYPDFNMGIFQEITRTLSLITPWFVTEKISFVSRLVIIGAFVSMLITAEIFRRYKFGKSMGNGMLVKMAGTYMAAYTCFTMTASLLVNADANARLFSPIFVFLILLLLLGLESTSELLAVILKKKWLSYSTIILCCFGWLLSYPLPIIRQKISSHKKYGVPGYNSVYWHRSEVTNWLKTHRLDGNVFSNEAPVVYFLTGHAASMSPNRSRGRNGNVKKFKQQLSLKEKNYLVWYYRNWRRHLYELNELSSMFKLERVAQFRDGAIFRVQ